MPLPCFSILRLRGIIDGLLNNLLIIFNSVMLLPSTYILSSGAGLCPLSIDDNITPPMLSLISSQPSEAAESVSDLVSVSNLEGINMKIVLSYFLKHKK